MIYRYAPDPFALASWRSNLIPVDDPDAGTWWICSLVSAVAGVPVIDELELQLARAAPLTRA